MVRNVAMAGTGNEAAGISTDCTVCLSSIPSAIACAFEAVVRITRGSSFQHFRPRRDVGGVIRPGMVRDPEIGEHEDGGAFIVSVDRIGHLGPAP